MNSLNPQDVAKLVECLKKLPPVPGRDEVEFNTPAAKLLDCVLSLNRRYEGFLVPRVRRFVKKHPSVTNLTDLSKCVAESGSPSAFYSTELEYDWDAAAAMFQEVLNYLQSQSTAFPGTTELASLRNWGVVASVKGYKELKIPLFGIAGWQYLRMLFGADTCKPDIAVMRFIKDCLERSISRIMAVRLMEAAAPLVPGIGGFPQPVREADRRIWHRYNGRPRH